MIQFLVSQNFLKDAVKEFMDIAASEEPKSKNTPFGKKTYKWISDNLPKMSEICKMAYSSALRLLEKAVSDYYGL